MRAHMRMNAILPVAVVLLCGLVQIAGARTAGEPWRPARTYDYQRFVKNQWGVPVTNYAVFGYGIDEPGGEWPAGSGDIYLFGAGIWIGCLRDAAAGQDTLVSVGYNPNSGKSEMTPGCYDNAPGGYSTRDFERVYLYPGDWPPDLADFPASMQDSVLTPLRIPPPDTTNPDTVKGYFYYIPRAAVSSGDGWAVFNDRDPANHVAGETPRPIGIEAYQSIYAWTLPWNRDIVFFKLDVRNRTEDTLRDVYLGMVCDADVGDSRDDRAGLALSKYVHSPSGTDSVFVDNMGYVWSDDAVPSGMVGFDFLQSPYVLNPDGSIDGFNGLDDNGNGLIDEPAEGRQLGMTSFKIFTLTDADPVDDFEQYLALAGYDYWDPDFPYNPYDSTDQAPADKRFLQGTGPFDLAPDQVVTVTIGMIAADRSEGGEDAMVYGLAQASRAAQAAYDNNWIMPEPPPSPNVTTIPGDGRVTLVWDDFPESAVDRFFPVAPALLNPYYVEQDFQGYKVYRSRTGQPEEWELLTQFDKVDGITYEDTTVVESLRTRATDAGLAYCYVDSSDLRLGFPYYYAVTAFDINYVAGCPDSTPPIPPDTLTLESGMSGLRAVPRTDPDNFSPPEADWRQVGGNTRLQIGIEPFAVSPHAVRDEVYRIQFLGPAYDSANRRPLYRFAVTDQAGDTVVGLTAFGVHLDSVSDTFRFVPTVFDSVITNIERKISVTGDTTLDTTRAWLPLVQMAMKLKMEQIPSQFYDHVDVVRGLYEEDSLVMWSDATNKAHWAYRGSHYRVVWRQTAGGELTCDVHDIDNDRDLPYRYLKQLTMPDSADGWCFQTGTDADSLLVDNVTYFMYICGARFRFQRSGKFKLVPDTATGDTWVLPGDTWVLYTRNLSPAPCFAAFEVEFTAMAFQDTVAELDVKVVPNPYLVRNEWERHPDFRKLKFINLPDHCTIRIYNLAGDLIRTLEHDETSPDIGGLPNQYGGDEDWDLLNESQQKPAPGIFIFHVESDVGSQVGKFVVIY